MGERECVYELCVSASVPEDAQPQEQCLIVSMASPFVVPELCNMPKYSSSVPAKMKICFSTRMSRK